MNRFTTSRNMIAAQAIAVAAVLFLASLPVLSLTGCGSWEQRTYQTLSSAEGVLVQASKDYNAGVIAKTEENRSRLELAQKSKDAAVKAFADYWEVKLAVEKQLAGKSITQADADQKLRAAAAAVETLLAQLGPLVDAIKALSRARTAEFYRFGPPIDRNQPLSGALIVYASSAGRQR